jgi:hypothetical protein
MQNNNRRLMWHGMFLFLLGLLTGFAETHFVNIRMGLAAHLEGVINGIFLLALGAAWNELRLAPAPKSATFWIALYGTYMNWFVNRLGRSLRNWRPLPDHRRWSRRRAMARKTNHGRLYECRPGNRRLRPAVTLGLPHQSPSFRRVLAQATFTRTAASPSDLLP